MSGSSISVGVCDHMGLSPPHPFFVCVSRRRIVRFLCSLLGGAWAQEAAGVVCGVGVGYLEALMLRYGGMPAPRVLMGCRKGFPAGFRGVDSMLSGSG